MLKGIAMGCNGAFTFTNERGYYNDDVGPMTKGVASMTMTNAIGSKGWGS